MESSSRQRAYSLSVTYGPERALQRKIKYSDEWYRKVKETTRQGAKERGKSYSLTSFEMKQLWEMYEKECYYCGISNDESEEIFGKRLTIDRINPEVGYHFNNCALACVHCNQIKDNYLDMDEMKIVGKIMYKAIKRMVNTTGAFKNKASAKNYWKEKYNG